MLQKELNEENKEIMSKAYELYEKKGFHDGNSFVDWLEAEANIGRRTRLKRSKQMRNILLAIAAILCVIVVILIIPLFQESNTVQLSDNSESSLKVMVLVLDPKTDEKLLVFGDTHFDFAESTLSPAAMAILDKDVQILNENPTTNVRMAGYTSAMGTEAVNQKLSEKRATAVRDYLIKKGIAADRITTIGYGRTKPALYEATPNEINTDEAKANMRVLFEVDVK
jgi:outer membrane protein OmpA-like peptidoglycan-associated protein